MPSDIGKYSHYQNKNLTLQIYELVIWILYYLQALNKLQQHEPRILLTWIYCQDYPGSLDLSAAEATTL